MLGYSQQEIGIAFKGLDMEGLTLEEIIKQAADYAKQIAAEANKQAADIVEQAKAKDKAIREALSENLNKSLSEAAEVLTKSLKDVNTTRDAVSKIGAAFRLQTAQILERLPDVLIRFGHACARLLIAAAAEAAQQRRSARFAPFSSARSS